MPNSDREFNKLSEKIFYSLIARNPISATYVGIHKYDHLMPDCSKKKVLEDIKLLKTFFKEVSKFSKNKLSFDKKIDRDLTVYVINLGLFSYEKHRTWESDPDAAGLIGTAIFPLFVRDFAPFNKRLKSIVARLEKSEKVYDQTKKRVSKPIKLWTEMAIESCDRLPLFLDTVLGEAKKRKTNKKLLRDLENSINKTKNSTENYKNYLSSILPKTKTEYILGKEKFNQLIKLRELGLSPDEILKLGERYLSEFKKQLETISQKIKPNASVEEAKEIVKSNHPKDFNEALNLYRKSIKKAREFVIKHNIATVPRKEKLIVIETPPYLRHTTPFAAYFSPAKFDKNQLGIYVVTPPENDPERMKEHSFASISNTSVHEAYPGHHLQLVCANTNPSLMRLMPDSTEFVEGWAHYCEEYMKTKGYDNYPEYVFDQTLDLIWRSCRIIIDVKLHRGQMSFDEAVDFLVREARMQKASAVAEVKRYTQSPGYQLSYLLGKHLIKQMKNNLQKKLGKKFSDKVFHDTLLYSGSLPIKYQEKILENKFK